MEKTNATGEINPKNRHCLRGLDGKYGRWDEILRDILNGKLKIVQNKKRAESETDDDDEDEETPEETGTPIVYDTSERDGRYVPTRRKTRYNYTSTAKCRVRIQNHK